MRQPAFPLGSHDQTPEKQTMKSKQLTRVCLWSLIAMVPVPNAIAENWTPAPSLNVPRERFGLTIDECGNIWAVGGANRTGGCSGGGVSLDSIERLDWSGQSYAAQWQLMPIVLPTTRITHMVVVSRGFLYVIGGYTEYAQGQGSIPLAPVDRYDLLNGSWSSSAVPPMPEPKSEAGAIADQFGRIWIIGGYNQADGNIGFSNTVHVFDPARPELGWQVGPSLNHARARCGITLDQKGRITVVGGHGLNSAHIQSIERLGPCSESAWTVLPQQLPAPTTNDDQCSIGWNGDIYVIGGYIAHTWINRVLRIRPESMQILPWASLIQARSLHRVVLGRDKYIYAMGGGVSGCNSTTACEKLYTGPSRPEPTVGPEE